MRHIIKCLATAVLAASASLANAQSITERCDVAAPPPNSPMATFDNDTLTQARYFGATKAYAHGILGDAIEADGLVVATQERCHILQAGPNRVFEDTAPRLVDLDGDGLPEVIVVATHQNQGARLEIYGSASADQPLRLLAATPYIGRSHRWLAPIGAADLDGDGEIEIAYIDRPHLAKTLRIWRYDAGGLREIAAQPGFSNHKIGWPMIPGGIRRCGDHPEMILASADWSTVQAVRFSGDGVHTRDIAPFTGPDSLQEALRCP